MTSRLPIADLIAIRCATLGINRGDLARLCGYANVSKGMRRLDALCAGDLHSASGNAIVTALPSALNLDAAVIQKAIAETDAIIQEAARNAREAYIASLVPSAWLLCEHSVPTQIVLFGITGSYERWTRIKLDTNKPPLTYPSQAMTVFRNTPTVPFLGTCEGFVVNYAAERAILFDVKGNPAEKLNRLYEPGDVQISLRGKRLPHGFGFYS